MKKEQGDMSCSFFVLITADKFVQRIALQV